MADATPAAPPFDAVLVVSPPSRAAVAGMRLIERAAFTLARAGARRLLCLGAPPEGAYRWPGVATTWTADAATAEAAAWIAAASPRVVAMDAACVVDPATVAALAADEAPSPLRAGGGLLRVLPVACTAVAGALAADSVSERAAPAGMAGLRPWPLPPGALLLRARDAAGRAAAGRALFARLGRPGDGWFTRVVDRKLSRALTRLLLPTGISPNTVTLTSIAIGLLAGALFAVGGPRAGLAGALLFLASTIIDGCDGELARLTFRESPFGARLDVIGDNVVHVAVFGGIAYGVYRTSHDPSVAIAGWALVLGVLASMAVVYLFVVRREPSARQRVLFEAFASREFAYLLVVLTLAGKLAWFLWLSAVGTYAFIAGMLALRRA
ncbi:MAG TPA: CDP-alcohol phosphatidyltransferase family protein [Candidatus Binatia bacterium]